MGLEEEIARFRERRRSVRLAALQGTCSWCGRETRFPRIDGNPIRVCSRCKPLNRATTPICSSCGQPWARKDPKHEVCGACHFIMKTGERP